MSKPELDDVVAAVREDVPSAEATEAAARRAWARLGPQAGDAADGRPIRGCADVRELLAAHAGGHLPPARALLVEDHLKECAACRAARAGGPRLAVLPWRPAAAVPAAGAARPRRSWPAVAAVALLGTAGAWLALSGGRTPVVQASVQSVTGTLLRVSSSAAAARPGQTLAAGEAVRTTRGSRAVLRLSDGSTLEMDERAELAVEAGGDDLTIHLTRGNIIVEAAKRKRGHLRVASGEATVQVTGTVFAVSHGLKGSRVSVIEGRVEVEGGSGSARAALGPGQQWTNSRGLAPVPVREAISWSSRLPAHLALLTEAQVLHERMQALPRPGLRHQSALLSRLPASTVAFASAPNYGQALAQAHRLFTERLQESAVLRDWWAESDPAKHGGPDLAALVELVHGVSEDLGDEVALALVDAGSIGYVPVILAEVTRPGLRERLQAALQAPERRSWPVELLEGSEPARLAAGRGLAVRVWPDFLAIATDVRGLRLLEGVGAEASLEQAELGQRLRDAYAGGVGLLFAADFERVMDRTLREGGRRSPEQAEFIHRSGLDSVRQVVVQRRDLEDRAHTDAVLAFRGSAHGVPSWLGAPAAMGSLDFVTPGAQVASAFVLKSPALIFDDVAAMLAAHPRETGDVLSRLESRLDLRLREDLAETLGAEVAVAFDGPVLPTPSWKLVAEVYDPGRLQSTLQALVARLDDEARREGKPGLLLEAEQVGEVTYYALRGEDLPTDVHYAFSRGYLVAAPSRALVMRAVQARESGDTLPRSARFRALFPQDGEVNVSGLVYQNFAPLVASLLEAPGLSPAQRQSLTQGLERAQPTVACAYGEPEAIRVAGVGSAFDLASADLTLPLLLKDVLDRAREAARTPQS